MRNLFVILLALTLGCTNGDQKESPGKDKRLPDLNMSEKKQLFSQVGETFNGDYRTYIGQNSDSTKIQFVLDNDKRFAIGFKAFFGDEVQSSDSTITFLYSNESRFINVCIGRWTDVGQKIRLTISLGSSDYFDSAKNSGILEIIDERTVLVSKDVREIWIANTLCKMP